MSLGKLKKAELQELYNANDLSFDPDWNKDELIEGLEGEGIEAESVDNEVSTDTTKEKRGSLHVSKSARQKRLQARTDRTA